ncbi:hypothetical protein I7I51_07294 [Histoplasma capsulatum]|uniref:Uncharacterized protein n=1 Tax=Ajellomyces capsulatus TaxID=5037 RepID=A0A8A1MQU9_AJECA|nr:hypothetical protein I7I51_07294 [Histoplasma capsulatum]
MLGKYCGRMESHQQSGGRDESQE